MGGHRRSGGTKIGRGACRGKGEISGGAGSFKKKKSNTTERNTVARKTQGYDTTGSTSSAFNRSKNGGRHGAQQRGGMHEMCVGCCLVSVSCSCVEVSLSGRGLGLRYARRDEGHQPHRSATGTCPGHVYTGPNQSGSERAHAQCLAHAPSFFFQAEDGIRDSSVTGVQTCALPISPFERPRPTSRPLERRTGGSQPSPG